MHGHTIVKSFRMFDQYANSVQSSAVSAAVSERLTASLDKTRLWVCLSSNPFDLITVTFYEQLILIRALFPHANFPWLFIMPLFKLL